MFDLLLLCLKQKQESKNIPQNTNIFIEYEQRYWRIWRFMMLADGVCYKLYANENEFAGTRVCKHIEEECNLALEWVEPEFRDCITPFEIDSEYMESFQAILSHLIEASPVKTVYLLARYQSFDREVVLGSFTLDGFLEAMKQKRIHANVCYIITGNEIAHYD